MYDLIVLGDCGRDVILMMGPEASKVYCVLNQDDCELCFKYAGKIPVEQKQEAMGGNAANVAVSATKLGLQVGLYTELGGDLTGQWVRQELEQAGVNTEYIMTNPNQETNFNTVINVDGERTILTYHNPRQYRLPSLGASKWLYLTSMKAGYETILPSILEYTHKYQVKICFQPGTYQVKDQKSAGAILSETELIIMNREEAELYTSSPDGTKVESLLNKLQDLGPKMVIITDGQKGCYAKLADQMYFLGTLKGIERVEATGAGDAFASATTSALILGQPLPEALRWGLMQASSVIQKIGAQAGLMDRSQLEQYLSKYPEPVSQNLNQELSKEDS